MSFFHICPGLVCSELIQRLLVVLSEVDAYFFHVCQDDEHIRVDALRQFPGCQVFFNDRAGAFEVIVLLHDRDASAAGSDHDLVGIEKGIDSVKLYDLHRIWSGYNAAEPFARLLDHVVPFPALFVGFLRVHVSSENFCGSVEGFIIGIHDHLGQYRADGAVDPSVQKLLAYAVLQVITDIALAHCRADGHWRGCVFGMRLCKFVHGSVDHPHLRCIAVCDRDLISFFDKVCDAFCAVLYSNLLFRERGPESPVSQGYDNSFFHSILHFRRLLSDGILFTAAAGPQMPVSCLYLRKDNL